MSVDEGNTFYNNSQYMEDYLDEDDEAIKMIKSGEFTLTFDQFMENLENEIKNVEIEENELLDVRIITLVISSLWLKVQGKKNWKKERW